MMDEVQTRRLIKDFEREARTDGLPAEDLAARKRLLVGELNGFITQKKNAAGAVDVRRELVADGRANKAGAEITPSGMTSQELMARGRKDIKETDASLTRSEKVVVETIAIGAATAATLDAQACHIGQQMERVLDNLEQIHFSMKKANQVLRDMTRGIATDRCLQFFLMVIVLAVVIIIILKVAGVGALKNVPVPLPTFQVHAAPPPAAAPPKARRLLLEMAARFAMEALLEVS
ncbi:hypothetical protein WJX81_004669 [Elliptochloris bilobata]|uniref:t-SNARE coiled-coil homology domain-containing protein n=1 Tax=Elliptochloris bilobata TaxID=381761 RepID=A0AAW1RAJ1_9CHLO